MSKSPTPPKKRMCCKNLISYSCKVWCMISVCLVLVAAAIALVYVLFTKKTGHRDNILLALPKQSEWFPDCPTTTLRAEDRFDCYPDDRFVDRESCEARGCCYLGPLPSLLEDGNWTSSSRVPSCVYPKNYGYVSSGKAEAVYNGFVLPLRRIPAPSRYGDDIQVVHLKVEMQTKYRLRIKFYDPETYRFEVPVPQVPIHSAAQSTDQNGREVYLYSITYDVHNEPFAIKVRRSSTDAVIFDTSAGSLSLSNQFLELTTRLISRNVHGFSGSRKHEFDWNSFSLFASSSQISSFGVHPMYLCMENDGNAHGLLLLNSNAVEIQSHPSPALTFRAIGGILDFYLFLGPSPDEVVQQYTEATGRPLLPPYWSLGLHIGRSAYDSTEDIEKFLDKFRSKHVPVESVVLNPDVIMKISTRNKNFAKFSNFTSNLRSRNQKVLMRMDAAIPKHAVSSRELPFSGSLQKDVFVTDKWGWNPIEGKLRNTTVVYPDFGHPTAATWWTKVLKKISSLLDFDGLWLINNEPTSSVDGSISGCLSDNLNSPPYVPESLGGTLYRRTLCMDALLHWRSESMSHYDSHNLYGHSMALSTEQALVSNSPTKRKLIISDSPFVGSGQVSGHSPLNSVSNWDDLHAALSSAVQSGIYGLPLTGPAVCRAQDSKNIPELEELCLKWFQYAVYFPLLQLNDDAADHFYDVGLNNREVFQILRNALSRRYELLPQLYTLFYFAHTRGSTVVRPLSHNFPLDNETRSLSAQFMWGSSLLISPIIEQGTTELHFYLPRGIWYDYYQGGPIYSSGEWFTESGGPFSDSKQPAVMHIRAGHVITLQKPAETTTVSRQNSMSILVALNSTFEAHGVLYWDDGETRNSHILGEYILVKYTAKDNCLNVTGHFGKKVLKSSFYKAAIEQVRIMGLNKPPKRIYIDKNYILSNKQYHWNYDTMVLDLKFILIPLGRKTELQWFF